MVCELIRLPVSYTHLDVYKRQIIYTHTHTRASIGVRKREGVRGREREGGRREKEIEPYGVQGRVRSAQ